MYATVTVDEIASIRCLELKLIVYTISYTSTVHALGVVYAGLYHENYPWKSIFEQNLTKP